ncbi:hypothetical protein SAMN05444395_104113 [Flavobacterium fryxellicola]|nr:hypothetical protein SAMN05444395_104113 [Flavobacterium fryxellicola]
MLSVSIWGKSDADKNKDSFLLIYFVICESVANYFITVLFLLLLTKTNYHENNRLWRKP